MPGASRAVFIAALLIAELVTACGAGQNAGSQQPVLSVGPASAPEDGRSPAGTVLALDSPGTAVVVDPRTGTVAIAVADSPELLLTTLDLDTPPQRVPLPAPAADLALAAEGGPLLVSVTAPGSLVRVPLDGGSPSTTDLDGAARGAVTVGGRTVITMADRLVILEGNEQRRTVPGFTDAVSLVPAGGKVAVLDRGRSAVSLVDPVSGEVGPALLAGNGAAHAVADRFGRILVTDVRDGELLAFAGDPLLLRQRAPLPGAPYGLAYDARRDLAWVTLTARNEVVGLDVRGGEPVAVHRFPTVAQPDAVAVDPATGRVVIVSASGAGLQVIDPETVMH